MAAPSTGSKASPAESHGEDPADRFQILQRLGEGSYGEVYSAIDRVSGATVALKVIPVAGATEDLRREIELLKACQSPYVVRYFGSYEKDGDLWIAMECANGGSLADLMAVADITLLEEEIAEAMAATLLGLRYLHEERRIIHRDLKVMTALNRSRLRRSKLHGQGVGEACANLRCAARWRSADAACALCICSRSNSSQRCRPRIPARCLMRHSRFFEHALMPACLPPCRLAICC